MEVTLEGTKFYLDGKPTYEGVTFRGVPLEGLLMNSRMIQALFDDENPDTRGRWAYPDTGVWDPDRNTDEFCAMLPEYRRHGLLAVTVGLQGGGSDYRAPVYDDYINSAFRPDGSFKQPYFDRLQRLIEAADAAGMVVIVNYFYWKQVARIEDDGTLLDIAERVTDWLLRTGHRNLLIDVANESNPFWGRPLLEPDSIPRVIDVVRNTTLDGRRILTGCSTGGGEQIPTGPWLDAEDFSMPHGNGCTPDQLRDKLRRLKNMPEYKNRLRPIVINEDSIFVENMEAAVEEGCSWGFYCQGYGSGYHDRMDWTQKERETDYADLSGYQTVPVNWGINTPVKKRFFERLHEITSGQG